VTPADVKEALRRNREAMRGPRTVKEACALAGLAHVRVRSQMSRGMLTADVAAALAAVLTKGER
jgi:hypothetical protein